MAKFSATVPLRIAWHGHEFVGPAGTVFLLDDALYDEFNAQYSGVIAGLAWSETESYIRVGAPVVAHAIVGASHTGALAVHGIGSSTHSGTLTGALHGSIASGDLHPEYLPEAGGTISGALTVTGTLNLGNTAANTGQFAVVDPATKRIPVNFGIPMVGAAILGDPALSNVVAFEVSPRFTGAITGIGGLDPGFVWGMSIFTTEGTAAVDGDGIVDLTGFVSEIALQSISSGQNVIRAMHAATSLWGAGSGGTVSQIEGLRISKPAFKSGALPGNWTISNVYGLFVEAPGTVGTNRFAIFTEGGPSRFTGRTDLYGDVVIGVNGRLTWGSTTFPASPTTGDLFYRTDRELLYFWDGARWLTASLFTEPVGLFGGVSTNTDSLSIVPGDALVAAGLFIEEIEFSFRINGGTALSAGSHLWNIHLSSYVGNTPTARAAIDIDSGASDVWRTASVANVNVALDGIDMYTLRSFKTGTPGTLDGVGRMVYRRIG